MGQGRCIHCNEVIDLEKEDSMLLESIVTSEYGRATILQFTHNACDINRMFHIIKHHYAQDPKFAEMIKAGFMSVFEVNENAKVN